MIEKIIEKAAQGITDEAVVPFFAITIPSALASGSVGMAKGYCAATGQAIEPLWFNAMLTYVPIMSSTALTGSISAFCSMMFDKQHELFPVVKYGGLTAAKCATANLAASGLGYCIGYLAGMTN